MVGIYYDDAVFCKREYVVDVEPDAYTEDSRPHSLMAKKTPPVEYIPDGPIMSCLQKPQLMYVKSERSTFMTKRKMNDEIMRDWKKSIASMPICCGRYIK